MNCWWTGDNLLTIFKYKGLRRKYIKWQPVWTSWRDNASKWRSPWEIEGCTILWWALILPYILFIWFLCVIRLVRAAKSLASVGWNGPGRRWLKKLTKMEEKKEEAKRNENGVNEQRGFNTNILRFLKWTLNINRKQGGEERSGHVSMRWVQTSAAAPPIKWLPLDNFLWNNHKFKKIAFCPTYHHPARLHFGQLLLPLRSVVFQIRISQSCFVRSRFRNVVFGFMSARAPQIEWLH